MINSNIDVLSVAVDTVLKISTTLLKSQIILIWRCGMCSSVYNQKNVPFVEKWDTAHFVTINVLLITNFFIYFVLKK